MDIFTIYILTFLVFFFGIPVLYYCMRVVLYIILEYCRCSSTYHRNRDNTNRQNGAVSNANRRRARDRQGNIFTISDDASVNGTSNRYADFFYLEPSSEDSARIRSQQEKDDKDLPSYEEVMGISNATVTTSTSATAINAAEPPLDVPPYSVTDPNTMAVIIPSTLTTIPVTNNAFSGGGTTGQPPAAPSTSRAAAAATSTTVLALPNSVSNMSV